MELLIHNFSKYLLSVILIFFISACGGSKKKSASSSSSTDSGNTNTGDGGTGGNNSGGGGGSDSGGGGGSSDGGSGGGSGGNTGGGTPPTASLSGTPGNVDNSTALNISIGGTSVALYQYKLGPTASTTCSVSTGYSSDISIAVPIINNIASESDGSLTLCVIAKDSSGLAQDYANATSFVWTKDTTAPSVAFTSPASGSSLTLSGIAAVAVSGTCSEDTRNIVITGSASATAVCSSNTWNASLDFSAAADGNVTIQVAHTDSAGNSSNSSRSYFKTTAVPQNLSYSTNPGLYTLNTAISNNNPSLAGGVANSFSISPALPAGLSIDSSTGVISGTPTGFGTTTSYVVTASNVNGSTTANLTILISAPGTAVWSAMTPTTSPPALWSPKLTFNYLSSNVNLYGGNTQMACLTCADADQSNPSILPGSWLSADVGSVGVAGSTTYASSTFTIQGSGSDIWDQTDQFQFVYQTLHGDGDITARIKTIGNSNDWAKAGVMIRESLTTSSKYAMMTAIKLHGLTFQIRNATNGWTAGIDGDSSSAPVWLKLSRRGNTLLAYSSSDGQSWTYVGQYAVSMATNVYAGIAVSAHDNGVLNTVEVDNVRVDEASGALFRNPDLYSYNGTTWSLICPLCGVAAPANTGNPAILPGSWISADIGTVGQAGSATYASGIFTLNGAGSDVQGSDDSFHYVYQSLSGDGEIVTKIRSMGTTNEWAKTGLMMRESLGTGARNVVLALTQGHGLTTQFRIRNASPDNGTVAAEWVPTVVAPVWLRLVRTGNTFISYYSTDGSSWSYLDQQTIVMNSNIYVGIFVCSHDTNALNTVEMDHVAVANIPGARTGHGLAYDSNRNKLILFGGTSDGLNRLNDVWEWDGTSWTKVTPTGTPPPVLYGAGVVFDSNRNKMVVFGGIDDTGTLNDGVYEYNGTSWAGPIQPSTRPTARHFDGATMAVFDSFRNRMVFYGGINGSTIYDDMWAWDGTTWTQLCSSCLHSNWAHVSMSYNAFRDRIILSNGWGSSLGEVVETWEFNGTSWTSVASTISARYSQGSTYDPVRKVNVNFGGYGSACSGNKNCSSTYEFAAP